MTTTNKSQNKDICYYAAFNFPAFIFVQGKGHWSKYRDLYKKLWQFPDPNVKKTLACSLSELASILGPEISQTDLIDPFNEFLQDMSAEVREGVFTTMHVFLAQLQESQRL